MMNFINMISRLELLQATINNTTPENKQLIVELGQSNMEGRDGDIANLDYPFYVDNAFIFDGTSEGQLRTTRGGAKEGSHANYFGAKYYALSGYSPVMLEESTGGSGLTSTSNSTNFWSASGTLRGGAEATIQSALTYYNLTSPLCALWCQGETDADQMDNNAAYTTEIVKAAMQDVIDWWFALYPDTVFLISETGDRSSGANSQGWQNMRTIQHEIASENSKVFIVFEGAKNFPSEGKMIDTYHYSYVGYQEMGESFATYLNSLL